MGLLVKLRERATLPFSAEPPEQGRWGGAVTLLRKTVRHGTVVDKSRKRVQLLGAWLPNVLLLNAFVAPAISMSVPKCLVRCFSKP